MLIFDSGSALGMALATMRVGREYRVQVPS